MITNAGVLPLIVLVVFLHDNHTFRALPNGAPRIDTRVNTRIQVLPLAVSFVFLHDNHTFTPPPSPDARIIPR